MGSNTSSYSSGSDDHKEYERDQQYQGSSWFNDKYTSDNYGNQYKKSDDDQYYGSSWHQDKYPDDYNWFSESSIILYFSVHY